MSFVHLNAYMGECSILPPLPSLPATNFLPFLGFYPPPPNIQSFLLKCQACSIVHSYHPILVGFSFVCFPFFFFSYVCPSLSSYLFIFLNNLFFILHANPSSPSFPPPTLSTVFPPHSLPTP